MPQNEMLYVVSSTMAVTQNQDSHLALQLAQKVCASTRLGEEEQMDERTDEAMFPLPQSFRRL